MREFEVNGYLTLRLENNNTVIYVNNKKFIHCKYLLINRYVTELEELLLLKSVDELEELLDNSMENPEIDQCVISPEVEFWGHCSNLQVWYENNYDTRLLHRNLTIIFLKL
ncbi:unnamed protein product [marine sediment metagenome]|uniref:Uncharacterized protein n=1 Tax=marine sediment metagenome TaxID=412755 RepID=X1V0K6_9ZZZZ